MTQKMRGEKLSEYWANNGLLIPLKTSLLDIFRCWEIYDNWASIWKSTHFPDILKNGYFPGIKRECMKAML